MILFDIKGGSVIGFQNVLDLWQKSCEMLESTPKSILNYGRVDTPIIKYLVLSKEIYFTHIFLWLTLKCE